jgi:hypothetical protein
MPHGKAFYSIILLFVLSMASVVQAADERNSTIQRTMDCVEGHVHQKETIGWNDICYYESESDRHTQIVNQQMDQVEGMVIAPPANEAPPKQSSDNYLIQNKEEKIKRSGFYATAAYDMNYMHYSEWSGLTKLDEDYGKQNGMYYAAGYRSPESINIENWIVGKPFVEAYYQSNNHDIHYKGALQSSDPSNPATIPYNSEQKSHIYQMGAKLGGYGDFADKGEVYAYGDIGKRIWYRGQDKGFDYREKYYWRYWGLGAGINYPFTSRLSVGLEGELLFAFNPRMYADGIDADFKLGTTWEAELKAPIKYFLLKNLSLDITPYFTYLRINPSKFIPDGNTGYGYIEPDSKTHEEGLLGGMTFYI